MTTYPDMSAFDPVPPLGDVARWRAAEAMREALAKPKRKRPPEGGRGRCNEEDPASPKDPATPGSASEAIIPRGSAWIKALDRRAPYHHKIARQPPCLAACGCTIA
jgi:hypothetical protein